MRKSAIVRARIEPTLKKEVESVFEELGVTPTQVIHMLYKQVQRSHELPLEFFVPNATTARAIKEARQNKGIVYCKNAEDLFKQLDI